jgi:hypothetical protein
MLMSGLSVMVLPLNKAAVVSNIVLSIGYHHKCLWFGSIAKSVFFLYESYVKCGSTNVVRILLLIFQGNSPKLCRHS